MSKFKSCVLALFLVVSVKILAQETPDSRAYSLRPIISKIEFLIGPSSVSIHGNEGFDNHGVPKFGYSYGIGFIHDVGRHVRLNSRILWERKGFRQSQDITYTPTTGGSPVTETIANNTSNDYLTVSVLPQFIFGKLGRFNIGAGGYFGSLRKSMTTHHYVYPIPHNITTTSK